MGKLNKWESSGILYESNDLLIAINKVNTHWKRQVD